MLAPSVSGWYYDGSNANVSFIYWQVYYYDGDGASWIECTLYGNPGENKGVNEGIVWKWGGKWQFFHQALVRIRNRYDVYLWDVLYLYEKISKSCLFVKTSALKN